MSKSTSKRDERISAFLDNEMHCDELVSFSLSAEASDASTAQRYLMVGDALRGEMGDASFIDVSSAVRGALADENIAEHNIAEHKGTLRSEVKSDQPGLMAGLFGGVSWFRPAAGMAMAALVAVVMVAALSQQKTEVLAPVADNTDVVPATLEVASDNKAKRLEPRVDQRLVSQHLEFATQDALQGRLPYVRAVSYEADK
ncbi:MAG TPA: hypothetical protein ENJ87_05200 [Gammaproteobacteria bacterium]|nr:hypothetical protein [Gammaproteobacteria bacterium]